MSGTVYADLARKPARTMERRIVRNSAKPTDMPNMRAWCIMLGLTLDMIEIEVEDAISRGAPPGAIFWTPFSFSENGEWILPEQISLRAVEECYDAARRVFRNTYGV